MQQIFANSVAVDCVHIPLPKPSSSARSDEPYLLRAQGAGPGLVLGVFVCARCGVVYAARGTTEEIRPEWLSPVPIESPLTAVAPAPKSDLESVDLAEATTSAEREVERLDVRGTSPTGRTPSVGVGAVEAVLVSAGYLEGLSPDFALGLSRRWNVGYPYVCSIEGFDETRRADVRIAPDGPRASVEIAVRWEDGDLVLVGENSRLRILLWKAGE